MALRFSSNAILLAIVLAAAAASASPESDAEPLVREGIEHRKEHRNDEALAAFRKAWAIAKTPRIRAQVALAEQSLGMWVDAEADLRAALDAVADAWIVKNRASLEDALARIEEHLGWLVVESNVAGAEVKIDGTIKAVTPFASPLRVAAGTVVVELTAKGYVPVKRPVLVLPKLNARESFALVAATSPPAPSPATAPAPPKTPAHLDLPPPSRPSTQKLVGFGVAALGLVGLGVGTYFGVVTLAKKSDCDGHCDATGCDPDGLAYDAEARTAATRSTIALAAGGVALVVGATLVLTAPRESSWHAIRVTPTVGPRVGGLQLVTTW